MKVYTVEAHEPMPWPNYSVLIHRRASILLDPIFLRVLSLSRIMDTCWNNNISKQTSSDQNILHKIHCIKTNQLWMTYCLRPIQIRLHFNSCVNHCTSSTRSQTSYSLCVLQFFFLLKTSQECKLIQHSGLHRTMYF